jgi:uncharacterized protein YegL
MEDLIACLGANHASALKAEVEGLRNEVANAGTSLLTQLQDSLQRRRNDEAAKLLERWRYFEPLTVLSACRDLPRSRDFETVLDGWTRKLEERAMQPILRAMQEDSWSKMVATPILDIARFGCDISRATIYTDESLTRVLDCVHGKFGGKGMQELAGELRKKNAVLANDIIANSEAFIQLAVDEFNRKTQQDPGRVKDMYAELNGGHDSELWKQFERFQVYYEELLSRCDPSKSKIPEAGRDPLRYLVKKAQSKVAWDKSTNAWSCGWFGGLENIPHVLGVIFAWWSVRYFKKQQERSPALTYDPNKLRRPNGGQVLCILRLLGASATRIELKNHLAEVPTGEGKSVIIGVLATTLALYGHRVDSVCYSSILSCRDESDFKDMFEQFEVRKEIRYGTFDTLCEVLITEEYGRGLKVRDLAEHFIKTGMGTNRKREKGAERVLIIDEVDVFCSEYFFGGAYCPTLAIKSSSIAKLMMYVWSVRKDSFDLHAIKQHPAYKAVLQSGKVATGNKWLLESAVRQMYNAARLYKPGMHKHRVKDGKIEYQIEGRDKYDKDWTYSYETNAEYLAEFERVRGRAAGGLDEADLEDGLALYVRCGEFAFAMLTSRPRNVAIFKHVLGVTGTLHDCRLPPQMKDILKEEVGVQEFTYCPSMYGDNQRDFQADNPEYVRLAANVDQHYKDIVDEIQNRLKPTTQMDGKRSVIVFFRDKDEIKAFRDSSYFQHFKGKAKVLTELLDDNDRKQFVKSAPQQGMVTLATRMFGRGTDFKIYDDRVDQAGGMHVLQTFFSSDLSEEVQIQGRCARQGSKGSYSLRLLSSSVAADFDLDLATIEGWALPNVYRELSDVRGKVSKDHVGTLRELKKKREQEHRVLGAALATLCGNNDAKPFGELMRRYNSAGGLGVGENGIHIILCLDESYSMQGHWQELVDAFKAFWNQSAAEKGPRKHVSVVQFGSTARVTQEKLLLQGEPPELTPKWSGTCFLPAIEEAKNLICSTAGPAHGYSSAIIFMSDGFSSDVSQAERLLQDLAIQHRNQFASYTVGFGSGASCTLERMAFADGVPDKSNVQTASIGGLANAFRAVATSMSPGRV